MNSKFIVLLLALIILPISSQARSISELNGINLVSYKEINDLCLQIEGYDPISGCYISQTDNIYIREDLPQGRFLFVLWHEIGHFFMNGTTSEQFEEVFNPTPAKRFNVTMPEIAADTYALYMMGGYVPENQVDFFKGIMK